LPKFFIVETSGKIAQNYGLNVHQGDGLGEFSPIGRLFSLGRLLNIRELAQIVGLLFSTVKIMHSF
jgi:hypothetical protein